MVENWDDDDPPFDDEASAQGHINAMGDVAHREAREEGNATPAFVGDGEGSDDPTDDPPPEGPSEGASEGGSDEDGDDDPDSTSDEGGKGGDGDDPENDSDEANDPDMSDPDAGQWDSTGNETDDEGGKGTDGEGSDTQTDQGKKGGSGGGIPWVAVGVATGAAAVAALIFGGGSDEGPSERVEADVEQPTDTTPTGPDSISQDGGGLQ
ncbi:hypothetical protein [Halostella sp. PRR32]|uniref:hypothetical protein n=1 Tax=Halostella sp. PRR32 TaxID=3098147 RepID=UPI002B1E2254|nr:hypothetical protein [Halostella sp. PRR32]